MFLLRSNNGRENKNKHTRITINNKEDIQLKQNPRKKSKKKIQNNQMSDRKKRFVKKFNKLFILAYIIFSIYVIFSFLIGRAW